MTQSRLNIFHYFAVALFLLTAGSVCAEPGGASTEDAATLEVLLKESLRNQESNPTRSLAAAQQALSIAGRINDPAGMAKALSYVGNAHNRLGDSPAAMGSYQQALKKWEEVQGPSGEEGRADSLLSIAILHWRVGSYDEALSNAFNALKIYEKLDIHKGIADALHNIGIINDFLGNYDTALEHHNRALAIRHKLKDTKGIADSLNNIGIIHYFQQKYKEALDYYLQAQDMYEKAGDTVGSGKALNNVGMIYKHLNEEEKALDYYLRALETWETLNNKYMMANSSNNIGEVYTSLGDYEKATHYLVKALSTARELDAKEMIRENYNFFSQLYAAQNDYKAALEYYKLAAKVKDELFNKESQDAIADMQTKYEAEKKERQIALLKKEGKIKELALERQTLLRNSLIGGLLVFFIFMFLLYGRYRFAQKVNAQLEEAYSLISAEKEKSDKLLLNILPMRVANDLKETGKTEPELFENVTVYFSDVVGFTDMSTNLEPKILIDELNDIFTAFDNIIERHQCERVKTIGDAYLCVCGMPTPNEKHAENVVGAAVEIVRYMNARNKNSNIKWHIRIGIHSGKVVGGVVGVKKYIYDVFGDTINTASRMESNSEPMHINISESTHELVKDKFKITPRGTLSVKGKGDMNMYFVETD